MRKENDESMENFYEIGFDDSEFFEKMREISEKYNKEFMEICLNAHEEYLIKMDNEELNEDYRNYLKENNIDREWGDIMKMEKTYDTKNKDILIFDWDIGRVLKYLEDNGIKHKPHKAYKYGTTQWVFVNLDRRTYTRGVGGIRTGSPLKHHAITFDEFKFIFGVYEEFGEGEALDEAVEHVYAKYDGKEIFTFHSERFDLEKPERWIEPEQREKKYINMHKDVIEW